ncbi:zinc finger CCCH domain-containing protein 7 [Iris pallida]|uniref:Zinc finger CCCH domain-containing protein 7 n=1 Tax=Iris pallida TaxID=29817 RepID=A0AAX6DSE2_IRIPA|nr:zinc finger CCCH domain-containing protein 7 [Iris pallida]
MENPLPIETLENPSSPIPKFSAFPLQRRRSHLDSASYRTLLQIFSLSLDESPDGDKDPSFGNPSPELGETTRKEDEEDRNGSEIDKDSHIGNPSLESGETARNERKEDSHGMDIGKDFSFGNPSLESGETVPNEEKEDPSGMDIDKGSSFVNPNLVGADGLGETKASEKDPEGLNFTNPDTNLESLQHDVIDSMEELEFDDDFDMEFLNSIMSDCSKLIGVTEESQEQLVMEDPKLHSSEARIQENGEGANSEQPELIGGNAESKEQFVIENPESHSSEARNQENDQGAKMGQPELIDGNTESKEQLVIENPKLQSLESRNEDNSNGADSEPSKVSDFEMSVIVEEASEGLVDEGEMEEGEISGEFDVSDDEPLSFHEDRKLEGPVGQDFAKTENLNHTRTDSNIYSVEDHIATRELSPSVGTSNAVSFNSKLQTKNTITGDKFLKPQTKTSFSNATQGGVKCDAMPQDISDTKAVERAKRVRTPLTEERKAKKKIAKKRKKAQKEREQGVKRLKLLPVVKSNKLKDCKYYLMGKCQQGSSCKFSHDATPMTKSQPCTFFARDSCLKGDDCPFDHQLSEYPCHNFTTTGICIRGDRCKFSHKLTTREGSSAIVAGKSDPLPSPGKLNLGKQLNMSTTPLSAAGPSRYAASSTQSKTLKPSVGNLLTTMEKTTPVPKGIRFLSFGKGPLDDSSKKKDILLPGNLGATFNQQNKDKLLGSQPKNASSFLQKSGSASQLEANITSKQAVCSPSPNATARPGLQKINFDNEQARVPSRNVQTEVSEASKILEEFLFFGGG